MLLDNFKVLSLFSDINIMSPTTSPQHQQETVEETLILYYQCAHFSGSNHNPINVDDVKQSNLTQSTSHPNSVDNMIMH